MRPSNSFVFAAVLFFAALVLVLPRLHAQPLPSPASAPSPYLDNLLNSKGTTSGSTFTMGKYDVDTSNLAKHSAFRGSANGGLLSDLVDNYKPPSAAPIPLKSTGHVPPLAVGKALGRFAAKSLPILSSALAMKELMEELGFTYNPDNPAATPLDKKKDGQQCSAGVCLEFFDQNRAPNNAWHTSLSGACSSRAENASSNDVNFSYTLSPSTSSSCSGTIKGKAGTGYASYSGTWEFAPPSREVPESSEGSKAPATVVQLEEAIEDAVQDSNNPLKAGLVDKISRALQDAISAGEKVKLTPQSLTGPASQPGTSSQSTSTAGGQTLITTNTTTNNYTYNGPSITSTVTNNTVVRTPAGDIVSTTDTETSPVDPDADKPPETPAADTPLPPLPELYEPKYPDGITGVWQDKKDDLSAAPLASLISKLMPAVGPSGQCPEMPINMAFASWADFGVVDFAPPCYVWDWARLIVIASALLLSRALIFGG